MTGNKGFSLIEIMVAVGIVGVAIVGTINIASLLMNSTSYEDKADKFWALQDRIRHHLNYQSYCDDAIGASGGQNQNTINMTNLMNGTQEITIKIPGIRAGPTMSSDVIGQNIPLHLSGLILKSIRLTNVQATGTSYVAQVEISAAREDGFLFKPIAGTTVSFKLNGNSIDSCIAIGSGVTDNICTDMGCTWVTSPAPGCQCGFKKIFCDPGSVQVGFSAGSAICQPIGGGATCPPGTYMAGFNLDTIVCANLPN